MEYFFFLPLAFFLSLLGTWLIVRLSRGRQWFDTPNHRSSHTLPTPTAGGFAFVSVFLLVSFLLLRDAGADFNYPLVLLLSACVALTGLVDDIFQLGVRPRIFTQLLAVAGVLSIFGTPVLPVFGANLELGLAGYLIAGIGFLWFINLFNFMDGIDGFAASEAIFICLAIMMIIITGNSQDAISSITSLLMILTAVVSGFLVLNYSPAKIFMGDTGSYFLGFILGISALASTTTGMTNLWVWGILAGVFIVDATYTLLIRIATRQNWYSAHRTHAFQIAADTLHSHGKVVLLALAINCCWLLPLAWLAHSLPQWGLVLLVSAWTPLLILVRWIGASGLSRGQGATNPGQNQ